MGKGKKQNMQVEDTNTKIRQEEGLQVDWWREQFDMKEYKSAIPQSVIISYKIDDDFVRVQFKDGRIYRYTNKSAKKENIKQMKDLIEQGRLDEFMDDEILANLYDRREA